MSSQNEREAYFHIKKLFSEPESDATHDTLTSEQKNPFESVISAYIFSDKKRSDIKDSILQYYIQIFSELSKEIKTSCGNEFKEFEELQSMIEDELSYSLQYALGMFFISGEMQKAIDNIDDQISDYISYMDDLLSSKDHRVVWYLHFDDVNKSILELIVNIHQLRSTDIVYLVNKAHELIQILQHLVTRKYSEYIS